MTTVTLFTQNGCPDSRRARQCLDLAGLSYVERNLSREPEFANDLLATGLFATPVVVSGTQAMLANNRLRLADTLGFACRCPDLAP
jgi:glutaredoxin